MEYEDVKHLTCRYRRGLGAWECELVDVDDLLAGRVQAEKVSAGPGAEWSDLHPGAVVDVSFARPVRCRAEDGRLKCGGHI